MPPGKQYDDYKKEFCDLYAAITFENNDSKIIFSKDAFISYLTQVNYRLSKKYAQLGYVILEDDQLFSPKSINDYIMLAHTVSPKSEAKHNIFIREKYLFGFKICIGERLIVILNNSNRYAYDCGKLEIWKSYYRDSFAKLTSVDIYFIWYINKQLKKHYSATGDVIPAVVTPELITKTKEMIKKFNEEERKNVYSENPFAEESAKQIADFIVNGKLDCLTELSYREVGLAFNNDIKENNYTDAQVSQDFINLINGKAQSLKIRHLPLLVAITMISEHGRNYNATIINLMLLGIISSGKPICATKKPIRWGNTIIAEELYDLNQQAQLDEKKITALAHLGGYFCMSQSSSFYENLLPAREGEYFTQAFYLRQSLYYDTLCPALVGPGLFYNFSLFNEGAEGDFFKHDTKPNLAKEKSFLIVAEWLTSFYTGMARIMSKKDYNRFIKNDSKENQLYRKGTLKDFVKIMLPFIMKEYGFADSMIAEFLSNVKSEFHESQLITCENLTKEQSIKFAQNCYMHDFMKRLVGRTILIHLLIGMERKNINSNTLQNLTIQQNPSFLKLYEQFLIDNRHRDPETQQAYDKRFGLINIR